MLLLNSAAIKTAVAEPVVTATSPTLPTVAHHNLVWTSDQVSHLIELIGAKLSYAQAAAELNSRCGTSYTRNALIGKAKRIGLECPNRPGRGTIKEPKPKRHKPRLVIATANNGRGRRLIESVENAETIKLRCVDIVPRHLSVLDLKPNDCRYPYGGYGEPVLFCGHPKHDGSSYCYPHFRLTLRHVVEISDAERQRRRQNFADIKRATA